MFQADLNKKCALQIFDEDKKGPQPCNCNSASKIERRKMPLQQKLLTTLRSLQTKGQIYRKILHWQNPKAFEKENSGAHV